MNKFNNKGEKEVAPKALREEGLREEFLKGVTTVSADGWQKTMENVADWWLSKLKQDRERIKERVKGDKYLNFCQGCNCDALDRFLQILDEEQS